MAMLFSLALWLGAALLALPGGAQAGIPATHYSIGDTVNFEFRTAAQFTNTGTGALTLTASDGTAVSGSPFTMTETWDGGTSEWVYTYAWATGGEASDTYAVQIADSDTDPTAGSSVILGNPPNQIDFFLDAAYTVPTDIFKQGSTVYVQVRLGSPETTIAASNLQSWGGGSAATGSTIDQTGTVFRYNFVVDFDSAGTGRADWGTLFWQGTDTGIRMQRAILNIDALLHTGVTTGSDHWNSDWGVTGTSKYGQFSCETCHERSTTNIKRIKTSIATADGGNWDTTGAPTAAVTFLSAVEGSSHFGDDAAGGRTTSNRVCEACHSVTDYHRYDITGQAGGTDHNNNTDCVSCHQHRRGFVAACDTCHGNPPPAMVSTKTTNAASAGAHAFHATTRNYSCAICHYSSVGQNVTHDSDGTVTLGFVDLLGPGTYTGGDYDGGATVSYDFSDIGTNVSSGGTNECSNIYCHGSTMAPNGGTDVSPKWDDPTTADCGTCHGGDAANPPTKGSHAVHAGSAGQALPCADCHNGLVPVSIPSGMNTHVDNSADFAFDSGKSYIGGATYSGTAAMLDAYGSCDSLYCHSNVQSGVAGDGAADTFASPTWGAGAQACDSCHGQAGETDGQPASGSHNKHAAAAELNLACGTCHNGSGSGTAAHADNSINVSIGAGGTYGQPAGAPGSGYSTCSATYCHSSVQADGGLAAGSSATPTWGGAAMVCDDCHGQDPDETDGQPATGSHGKHAGSQALEMDYACSACHFGSGSGTAAHVDQTLNVAIDSSYGASASYSQGDHAPGALGYGNCSNAYCHSNVQSSAGAAAADTFATPVWGGSVTCDSCHGQEPDETDGQPASGSHSKHAGSQAGERNYACTACHFGSGSGTAAHADQTLNVDIDNSYGASAAYAQGDHAPGAAGFDSCSNVSCHSNVQSANGTAAADTFATPTWGGAALCDSCHGQDPDETDGQPASGSHSKHAGNQAGEANLACSVCHFGSGSGTAAHSDSTLNVDIDNSYGASAAYSQGDHAPGSLGYGTCSSAYCHSSVQADGGAAVGAYDTPAWGGAIACDSCHGQAAESDGQPSTGSHGVHAGAGGLNLACTACHFGSGSGTAAHFDQTLNVAIDASYGGTYSQGNHAPGIGGYGNCATNDCHGSNSDNWGTNLGTADTCTKCHGQQVASPTEAQKAPGGSGVDTNGNNLPTDPEVGAHQVHLTSASNYTSDIACSDCHQVPSAPMDGGHLDGGGADMTWSNLATNSGGLSPAYNGTSCSNTYCHGNQMPAGSTSGAALSPSWAADSYLNGTYDSDCGQCHGFPPTDTSSHSAMTPGDGSGCSACHPHLNDGVDASESGWAGGAFNDPSQHINGSIEANSDCIGCHTAYPPTSGAHVKHFNHITTNRSIADGGTGGTGTLGDWSTANYPVCSVCHDMSNSANHQDATDYLMGAPKASWQFGTGNPTYAPAGQTCSNVKCHFTTTPDWQP